MIFFTTFAPDKQNNKGSCLLTALGRGERVACQFLNISLYAYF